MIILLLQNQTLLHLNPVRKQFKCVCSLSFFLLILHKLSTMAPSSSKYDLTVQNIVCGFCVGSKLKIKIVVELVQGRYDGKVFPACVTSSKSTGVKSSIFDSGQIINAGSDSYMRALLSAYELVDLLREGFNACYSVYNFEVKNIVCSANLGFCLNLDLFRIVKRVATTYDSEKFAGLTYELRFTPPGEDTELKVGVVAFPKGPVVVTGVKKWTHIETIKKKLAIFKAFELNNDFRTVTDSSVRDQKYGPEWREWGLVLDEDDVACLERATSQLSLSSTRKKNNKAYNARFLKTNKHKETRRNEASLYKAIKQFRCKVGGTSESSSSMETGEVTP